MLQDVKYQLKVRFQNKADFSFSSKKKKSYSLLRKFRDANS